MPTIQVVLNPVSKAIKGGAGDPRVVGLKLDLNLKGKFFTANGEGVTLATTSPQPAELGFYEVARGKDSNAPQPGDNVKNLGQQFAKLEGRVRLADGKPVFDVGGKLVTYHSRVRTAVIKQGASSFPPETSTDYCLGLELSSAFENGDDVNQFNRRLFLPWLDFAAEDGTIDIGCDLTIGGKLEFKFDEKNFVAVSMRHQGVRLDGVDEGKPGNRAVEFHGVGVVHPTRNWLLGQFNVQPGAIRFAATPRVTIKLHQGVSTIVKSFDRVGAAIRECFAGTGIAVDLEVGLTDAQADAAGFVFKDDPEAAGDKAFLAKDLGAGAPLPFFTYWVFFATRIASTTAAGLSEGILKVGASGASSTKAVRSPIYLLGGPSHSPRGLQADLDKLVGDEHKDRHVGNVIAHEVGHSFGFDHTLQANPDLGYRLRVSSPDLTRCVMCWENLGAFTFTRGLRFGPVFMAMLKRDFGLS